MFKSNDSIFKSRHIWFRLLKHLVIVVVLAISAIICLGYLSLGQVSKEFVRQVVLSMLAADIFYVFTELLPDQRKKKQTYKIVIAILNSSVDNYLNCILYILSKHQVDIEALIKSDDVSAVINKEQLNHIIATTDIWQELYQSHDWRELVNLKDKDKDKKSQSSKNIQITHDELDYYHYFIEVLNDLEHNIGKCLKRYSTILDSEYVILLELINNSFLIINRNNWDYHTDPKYVNYNLKQVLHLEQMNKELRKKYNHEFEYFREQ